jgi:4-hydroxy-tetrahydrodipicolinate synthase
MGADGVISVVANALPELFNEMVHASMKGDLNKALPIHFDLIQITKYFFQEGNPAGVKEALKARGICETNLRLPLVEVSSELAAKIKSEVTRLTK